MMWASLKKLRDLPGDTRVYCGHEYTLANIRFAQTIEPNNTELMARAAEAAKQIADGQWTIPTTIDEEKAANPFLRADVPAVAAAVGLAGKPAAEVFAEIRRGSPKSGPTGRISFEASRRPAMRIRKIAAINPSRARRRSRPRSSPRRACRGR